MNHTDACRERVESEMQKDEGLRERLRVHHEQDGAGSTSKPATQDMEVDKADGGVKKEVDVTTLQQWIDALKVDPVFKTADRLCELTKKISGVFTLTAPELNADLKSICKGSE